MDQLFVTLMSELLHQTGLFGSDFGKSGHDHCRMRLVVSGHHQEIRTVSLGGDRLFLHRGQCTGLDTDCARWAFLLCVSGRGAAHSAAAHFFLASVP